MNLFYHQQVSLGYFNEEESKHIGKVMRYEIGDTFLLTDGSGLKALCSITDNNFKKVAYKVLETEYVPKPNKIVQLFISPPKTEERVEWMLEKVVEIGANEIYFINTERAQFPKFKESRLEKIVIAALKQSKQYHLPKLALHIELKEAIKFAQGFQMVAHLEQATEKTSLISILERNKSRLQDGLGIWIGPEGDFSQKEIAEMKQSGISAVSLGSTILRTETAAIYAVSICKALAE